MPKTTPMKRLFAAVILQAFRDLKSKDKSIRNDAQFFLTNKVNFYLDYLGISKPALDKRLKLFIEDAA